MTSYYHDQPMMACIGSGVVLCVLVCYSQLILILIVEEIQTLPILQWEWLFDLIIVMLIVWWRVLYYEGWRTLCSDDLVWLMIPVQYWLLWYWEVSLFLMTMQSTVTKKRGGIVICNLGYEWLIGWYNDSQASITYPHVTWLWWPIRNAFVIPIDWYQISVLAVGDVYRMRQ